MAIDLAQLVVSLEANSAKFTKDMERVDQRLKRFERNARSAVDNVRAAFVGLGIGALVREAFKAADAIGDSAKRVGLTARAYQELSYAATQLDVDHGALEVALTKFNKTLGDARLGVGEAAKAFKTLGIDPRQFRNTDEAFAAVTKKLGGVEDGFVRASLQAQLFGKDAGPKLADFLGASSDAVERLRSEAHALGAVLSDEAIDKADETAKKFAALEQVMRVQLMEATVNLAPALNGLAGGLQIVSEWFRVAFTAGQDFADFLSRLAAFGSGEKFIPDSKNDYRLGAPKAQPSFPPAAAGQGTKTLEKDAEAARKAQLALEEYGREWHALVQAQKDAEEWDFDVEEENKLEQMSASADQAARNIQSFTASMVDAAMAGEDMGDVIVASLRRIAAELLTSAILQQLGDMMAGSSTPWVAGIGKALQGRADGGPVSGGTPYMVGERGPELFVPRTSGTIVPNGGFGGGLNITQHIDARGADPASAANMLRALDASNRRLKAEIYEEQRRGYAPA